MLVEPGQDDRWRPQTALEVFGFVTGPALKVERANVHIVALQRAIYDYFRSEPFRVETSEPNGPARIRIDRPVPAALGAMLGEVVHSLRSALDLLACDLAQKNGQTSKTALSETYFPIARNKEAFDKKAAACLKRLSEKDRAYIIDLQPYKGGSDNFWYLHELDNLDKHRQLLPVLGKLATYTGPSTIQPSHSEGVYFFKPSLEYWELKDGDLLPADPRFTKFDITHLAEFGFDLAFGKGGLEGRPLFPTLLHLGEGVVRAITELGNPG